MLRQREMTAEEFLIFADQHDDKRFDFIDGEMVEVSPKAIHGGIQSTFAIKFGMYLEHQPELSKTYKVYTEVLHVLGGKKMMPDVCINSRTSEDYFNEAAPLVAVEIRSDSQSKAAQRRKAIAYIDNGVKLSILVFPGEGLEVFQAGRDVQQLTYGATLEGGDVLPDFSVAVDELL